MVKEGDSYFLLITYRRLYERGQIRSNVIYLPSLYRILQFIHFKRKNLFINTGNISAYIFSVHFEVYVDNYLQQMKINDVIRSTSSLSIKCPNCKSSIVGNVVVHRRIKPAFCVHLADWPRITNT